MAAVKDLPANTITADSDGTQLRDDAEQRRRVDRRPGRVTGTTTGSCDGGFGLVRWRPPASVWSCTPNPGRLQQAARPRLWKEDARAIAQASQVTGAGGWLPFGVRLGAFTDDPPTQFTITPCDQSHNVGGAVNTRREPNASSTAATRSRTSSRARDLRRRRRVPDHDRAIDPDPDGRQRRQHHEQGPRRPDRQQHRLLQRRLRAGRERRLVRQEARFPARRHDPRRGRRIWQLASLRQRDDDHARLRARLHRRHHAAARLPRVLGRRQQADHLPDARQCAAAGLVAGRPRRLLARPTPVPSSTASCRERGPRRHRAEEKR